MSVAVLEQVEALVPLPARKGKEQQPLQFITAGDGGLLRSWDGSSGRCITKQPPPGGERASLPGVTQLARCGKQLLAVTEDHNLVFHRVDNLVAGRCIVGYNDEITDLKYLPLQVM